MAIAEYLNISSLLKPSVCILTKTQFTASMANQSSYQFSQCYSLPVLFTADLNKNPLIILTVYCKSRLIFETNSFLINFDRFWSIYSISQK